MVMYHVYDMLYNFIHLWYNNFAPGAYCAETLAERDFRNYRWLIVNP